MCGILGVLAFGDLPEKKQEKLRQESMIFLSSELLQLTQPRGKDATGIATMFSNCDYMGLKMGIPPTEFVARFGGTEKDFDGYLNIWRKKSVPAKMVIGHCRKSSVGNPEDNVNNHPIKVEDIIGVHNGTLTNHDQIFKLLKCNRDGTVDSEAIFRLLHHFTNNGSEPFAPKVVQEVCKRLHGTYSCLSFSGNNPYQMIGFRDARPMETLLIKPLKLLLIASDTDFLKHAIFRYNKLANLYQTGTMKFPSLKKTDVELSSLPDDHLYIFDIRKEVENTSKIKDLFIKERIPRTGKIWGFNTSSAFNTQSDNIYQRNNNVYQSSNTDYTHTKETDEEKKNKSRLGMAWNKKTGFYQDITNLKQSKSYPNVEIDSKNGEVIDADTRKVLAKGKEETNNKQYTLANSVNVNNNSDQNFELVRSYKDIDSSTVTPAKIKELLASAENLPVPVETAKIITDKTEVILETNPDALEKAEIALREEKNFSDIKEVQLALEIEKEEDLKHLSLYSLANRIKRFFYKKGWYNGYMFYLHELEESKNIQIDNGDPLTSKNLLIRANNKRKMAEKNIRTTKTIIQIFNHIVTAYGVTGLDEIGNVSIDNAVDEILTNKNELSTDLIRGVFKPGDFKNIPILRKITSSITSKTVARVSKAATKAVLDKV